MSEERDAEPHASFTEISDAEQELIVWSEARSALLPVGWRSAHPKEIAKIDEDMSMRLLGILNHCMAHHAGQSIYSAKNL